MVDVVESTVKSESIYRKSTDMACQEEVRNLKNKLDGWKQVLQPLYSLLIWEQTYYPAILTGIITVIFMTETQENKHDKICKAIIQTKQQTSELWSSFVQFRDTMPKLYFVSVLVILLVLAWIGNVVDSMLLTYFIVLAVVMLPGLKHQGIIQKLICQRVQQLKNILGQKLKKN
ncbi:ADP-ribosylation factor-like protein 6-interacting protein 1 isoform X4 [Tachypleus tridentatus]|uniref:ADP-ribosylation factor-like protein 6-interacting protein 1 isoform X4 n=1 Tax=Tachypleus tridentatus TaxID=6853 RepID=UPI003FD27EF5